MSVVEVGYGLDLVTSEAFSNLNDSMKFYDNPKSKGCHLVRPRQAGGMGQKELYKTTLQNHTKDT